MPQPARRRPVVTAGAFISHIDAPPPLRLVQRPGAPAALMPSEWTDPEDIKPDAKHRPRSINGWRTYDPLRRMLGHAGTSVTVAHVRAADKLRESVDLATMGFSGQRPLIYVQQVPQPRFGLGPAALAQMRAVRSVRRVVRLFAPPQIDMLDWIVLRNLTLRQWTHRITPTLNAAAERRRLLVILDRLAEHFDAEVQDDIARGRRLA